MCSHQFLGRFQFKEQHTFDDQIRAKIAYLLTMVEDWHRDFGLYFQTEFTKPNQHRTLIYRLKKSKTELIGDIVERTNHLLCKL